MTRSKAKKKKPKMSIARGTLISVTSVVIAGSLAYILYRNDYVQPLPPTRLRSELRAQREKYEAVQEKKNEIAVENAERLEVLPFHGDLEVPVDDSAWGSFSTKFALFSSVADLEWGPLAEKIKDFVMPEWAQVLPDYISKLQRELSMAPGSLADEIWQEAHDPYINPEIEYSASVRVSNELCKEEKDFLEKRKKVTTTALAKYLGIPEEEVHPDDVPCIASKELISFSYPFSSLVSAPGSLPALFPKRQHHTNSF